MSDAPKRIWTWPSSEELYSTIPPKDGADDEDETEYIRADLIRPEVLERAATALSGFMAKLGYTKTELDARDDLRALIARLK